MKCERIQELLLDALDGTMEPDFAASVDGHIAGCGSCRRDAEEAGEIWAMLGELGSGPSSAGARARFDFMLEAERASSIPPAGEGRSLFAMWLERLWPRGPALQVSLHLVALLIGVGMGIWIGGESGRSEMHQMRYKESSMLHAVTLSLLEHQSASERLRAVNLSEALSPDDRLVEALLQTIRDDPNVNVRLAALGVLGGLTQRTDVRSGLTDAFPGQDSPVMQVAMSEVLLAMGGEVSRREIRKSIDGAEIPETVRNHLLEVLAEEELET